MYAARQNAVDAARALAEAGADLNLTDPDGTTALVLAIINGHFDLARMLVEKGADPNVADTRDGGAVRGRRHEHPGRDGRPAQSQAARAYRRRRARLGHAQARRRSRI